MFSLKTVELLRVGDYFLWADDYTRDYMCVDESPDRLQVLQFVKLIDTEHQLVGFKMLHGNTEALYYTSQCLVLAFRECGPLNRSSLMHPDILCDTCGGPYSQHRNSGGYDILGLSCDMGDDKWFVPSEKSLREYYPTLFRGGTNDFFVSLGL